MELNLKDVPEHIFSANEIRQYSECARKRYYSSRDCLAVRAVKPNGNLVLGKKVHEMLEYYYMHGQEAIEELVNQEEVRGSELPREIVMAALERVEPFQLTDDDAAALGSDLSTFNCIHENYKAERLIEDLCKYEPLQCEMEFKLNNWPLDGVQYHGQIDMVVRERSTGAIWFFEHKTCKDFRPEIYNRFDIQLHLYTVTGHSYCNYEDVEWGGIILNEIKKAKTARGYAEHRMFYAYSVPEMRHFVQWLTAKTKAAISPSNMHEPCNTYMTCKMCEYASICLAYGYEVPQSHEEILGNDSLVDEETKEPLYKYDPRGQEEENE